MQFNTTNFVLDILSSDTILAENQTLLKVFIADSIGKTPIESVEYKITQTVGRNNITLIQDWEFMEVSGTFYKAEFTPSFTTKGQFEIMFRVTDTDLNTYPLQSILEGVLE